jgi:hypothetical protein
VRHEALLHGILPALTLSAAATKKHHITLAVTHHYTAHAFLKCIEIRDNTSIIFSIVIGRKIEAVIVKQNEEMV